MPLAVTHVLLTIVIVGAYRDFVTKHKKYFSLHTILVAGIAGLLPDIDVPLGWITNLQHGTVTHTPLFGLLFLIPAFILYHNKKHKMAMYFYVISFGILFHLLLDLVLGGGAYEGIMLFWPLYTYSYKIHLFSGYKTASISLDAIILLVWLYEEEIKHKIKDFI